MKASDFKNKKVVEKIWYVIAGLYFISEIILIFYESEDLLLYDIFETLGFIIVLSGVLFAILLKLKKDSLMFFVSSAMLSYYAFKIFFDLLRD